MKRFRALLLALALAGGLGAQARLLVEVIDRKTGVAITNLKAADFNVLDDKTPRRVQAAAYGATKLDVMLLVDTSLVGEMARPLGEAFIGGLEPKEQMAIVSFASAADLIQDFTSSQELLRRAVRGVKYGNSPHVVDAVYAAADGGFQSTVGRKVIVILSAGVEGYSRTSERDALRLARQNQISIFPVYVVGAERGLFERLARDSGGAYFSARDLKLSPAQLAGRVYAALRGRYTLTLAGNQTLGEKLKVEVSGGDQGQKLWASGLPVE
ncbi:MAG TPA: VWA domain-containing protein [Bryobacterales bacterium]|nr:VWA domain-containing protein [Bryobacterales bacterium]